MLIGVLQIEIAVDGSTSLKDKRRVVSSLKDRLHREHQVSVAEVAMQDNIERAVIGIVMASSDAKYCRSVLDKIADKLKLARGFSLMDHKVQLIEGH